MARSDAKERAVKAVSEDKTIVRKVTTKYVAIRIDILPYQLYDLKCSTVSDYAQQFRGGMSLNHRSATSGSGAACGSLIILLRLFDPSVDCC